MDSRLVEAVSEEREDADKPSEDGQETVQQGTDTSLNSFSASPEVQACREWWDFLDGYDSDNTIHMEVTEQEENKSEQADEYEDYVCYTDEMRDKVDEICASYGLVKLSGFCMMTARSFLKATFCFPVQRIRKHFMTQAISFHVP